LFLSLLPGCYKAKGFSHLLSREIIGSMQNKRCANKNLSRFYLSWDFS